MTPMTYFFIGLFLFFFLAFVWQRLTCLAAEELNEYQAKRIAELSGLHMHWKQRAEEAEKQLRYNA